MLTLTCKKISGIWWTTTITNIAMWERPFSMARYADLGREDDSRVVNKGDMHPDIKTCKLLRTDG